MPWRPLHASTDRRFGKLHRLKVAARAGIAVPPTVWAPAHEARDASRPPAIEPPLMVRSAAADEDRAGSSAAGRYESVVVEGDDAAEFSEASARVAASMGNDGLVFVQPLAEAQLGADRAGVALFDGFHFERTELQGHNRTLTGGEERGDVVRADLARDDPWSDWLECVGRAFRTELDGAEALDIEYARCGERFLLLQIRPASFPVRRNPILSLANHREILGELPSPWTVDALERAGRGALDEFARIDPEVGRWGAQYAEVHAGRAWLSFSFFFRLMDHWGLPRTFVTEGVGGESHAAGDASPRIGRMLRKSPRLVRLQLANLASIRSIRRRLAAWDEQLNRAKSLQDWFDATVAGLDVALRTNFAINGALSGATRVRRAIGVRGRARVVTEEMMDAYADLRALPRAEREGALDAWLERFGHRGPLESDVMQPRFSELRDVLLADVLRESGETPRERRPEGGGRGALYALDRVRESFRDELMKRWRVLRAGILDVARAAVAEGALDKADDAFLLDGASVGDRDAWRDAVATARERRKNEILIDLPTTARREEILSTAKAGSEAVDGDAGQLTGIGLGDRVVTGVARRADDLTDLLRSEADGSAEPLGPHTVLIVPALEPAWGVVFSRVGGVVTEIGGELSHASILLREAGTPALVNCTGVWRSISDGDEVELDEGEGTLRLLG
ncbi:MAG: PEP-utilizing enzyme [Planctomycetota bacterium]